MRRPLVMLPLLFNFDTWILQCISIKAKSFPRVRYPDLCWVNHQLKEARHLSEVSNTDDRIDQKGYSQYCCLQHLSSVWFCRSVDHMCVEQHIFNCDVKHTSDGDPFDTRYFLSLYQRSVLWPMKSTDTHVFGDHVKFIGMLEILWRLSSVSSGNWYYIDTFCPS